MARYYGTIQGTRGPTSRLGDARNGLMVTAQSYQGDIVVQFFAEGERDDVHIEVRDHGHGSSQCLYSGPIKDLLDSKWRDALVRTFAEEALLKQAGHK